MDAVVVSATRVPVIKFTLFEHTSVDVVFVAYHSNTQPSEEDMLPLSVFQRMSKDTRQSIQGFRTVIEIRRRLPLSMDLYSATLRAIKYWAIRRRVYGNNYGFPSGVSLAIMVARVCQVFPATLPSVLVRFFFLFYRQWLAKQGALSPLFITEQIKPDIPARIMGMWDSWDPHREGAKDELLVVLNPAYPHNNCCYNVGRSGLEHFYREIVRAHALLQQNQQAPSQVTRWDDLWPQYSIGDDYQTFLVVEVARPESLSTQDRQGWESWTLLIESKLKILLYSLETWQDVRLWPKRLESPVRCVAGRAWAFGLKDRKCLGGGVLPSPDSTADFAARVVTSVEDFRFAVEETGVRGPNPFQRNVATMPNPHCFIVTTGETSFPNELRSRLNTKRPRTDDYATVNVS